jgi:predicted RND superfamily exporter protein
MISGARVLSQAHANIPAMSTLSLLWNALVAVGVVAIAAAGGKWFLTNVIEKRLSLGVDKKLKEFEDRLGRERDQFNSILRVEAFMRESRIAAFTGRQVEAMEELHERLVTFQVSAVDLTALLRAGKENETEEDRAAAEKQRWDRYSEARSRLAETATKRGLYYDQSLLARSEDLIGIIRKAVIEFQGAIQYPQTFPSDTLVKSSKAVAEEADAVLREIVERMRSTLHIPASIKVAVVPIAAPEPKTKVQ